VPATEECVENPVHLAVEEGEPTCDCTAIEHIVVIMFVCRSIVLCLNIVAMTLDLGSTINLCTLNPRPSHTIVRSDVIG